MFLYIYLVLLSVFLIGINVVAWGGSKKRLAISAGLCVPAMIVGIGLPIFLMSALLVGIAALLCMLLPPRRFIFPIVSVVAALIFPSIGLYRLILPEMQQLAEFRNQYPLESVSARLAYEKNRPHPTASVPTSEKATQEFDDFEQEIEQRNEYGGARSHSLEMVHASYVRQFVNSPGFGIQRGRRLTWSDWVAPGDDRSIPKANTNRHDDKTLPSSPGFVEPSDREELSGDLRKLNKRSVLDFLDPNHLGYVRNREEVAGFISHQFSSDPSRSIEKCYVRNLELISLLKHDPPAAYLSENLPRMEELRDAKTRPLDNFETAALAALEKGENLQINHEPNRIRMLGSIRAAKACLKCHSVERGTLLGAFSYDLRPASKQ
jgi:hypothetical protein